MSAAPGAPAEGAALGAHVLRHAAAQFPPSRAPKLPPLLPLSLLLPRLCADAAQVWAPSTWKDRLRLWRRLHKWCASRSPPLLPTPFAACLFLSSLEVLPATKAAYASSLSSLFLLLDPSSPPRSLTLFARGLRAGDEAIPRGAVPVLEEQILRLSFVDSPLTLPALFAWKAAARMAEVLGLTVDHILFSSPRQIVVHWRKLPKGRRTSPFRTSSAVVLEGRFVPLLAAHIARQKNLPRRRGSPPARLFPFSSRQVVAHLRAATQDTSLTGHSLKKGAARALLALDPPPCPLLLSRLLKHSSPDPTPSVTVRYASDVVRLARFLGTQALTRRI